jgi:signal transduction histidine kinase/DNA-binding response OmpR family regulator/streptogramin lyase
MIHGKDRMGRTFLWDFTNPYLLDTITGQASSIKLLPKYSGVGSGKGKMLQDKNGDFWWVVKKESTSNAMLLLHLNEQLELIKEYDLQQDGNFQYAAIIQDKNGFIWIANRNAGMVQFNPKTGEHRTHSYSQYIPNNEIVNSVINLYEDVSGTIWICTNKGLLRASFQNTELHFTIYKNDPQNPQSLPNNIVSGVLDDPYEPSKKIWIATHGGGLVLMDKQTGIMQRFTKQNGLLNDNVVGILDDEFKKIWISTYKGITRIEPEKLVFKHFSTRDGLQSDEFNTGVFCKSPTGELLFGGINGLNSFDPKRFNAISNQPANVKIIGIRLNNEPIEIDSDNRIITESVEYIKALNLSHKQNQLTFEFSTLDMQNANAIMYRYQMEGIDNVWVQSGTNRIANYAQLPPGNYTLKVAASYDGLDWTNHPRELKIKIHPAWYQTWQAYLVYIVLLLSFITWGYFAQIRRIKLQNQLAFETKEAARLVEIDQLKTHFFNNISHEFRTPLSLLVSPIDDLKTKYPDETVLEMMKRNGQRLLSLINQLLDLGKLEAKEMPVHLVKGNVLEFIYGIASSFDVVANKNEVLYQKEIPSDKLLTKFDPDKLEKIITNLLSNAFKFTDKGKSIRIVAKFDDIAGNLNVDVSDTGAGIAPDKLDKIFDRFYQVEATAKRNYEGTGIGLALVKELITLLNGKVSVSSQLGKETSFTIVLPLQKLGFVNLTQIDKIDREKNQLHGKPNEKIAAIEIIPQANATNENVLLIVEDNEDLRAYVKSIFQDAYQIVEARDGEEGFQKAVETIPDIIISDVMMPKIDGYEFCKNVKTNEATSHIPIILLTAKSSLESRIGGLQQGADDYLTKPFSTKEIQVRVDNLIRNRELLRQLYSQKQATPEKIPALSLDEAFINKANAVIDRFIDQSNFDVEHFASEMNLSSVQLRRKLKAITNYTTIEYVRKRRLQKASEMLALKSASVSQIAYDVGFESLSYFSKAFQQEYGVLPSEFEG